MGDIEELHELRSGDIIYQSSLILPVQTQAGKLQFDRYLRGTFSPLSNHCLTELLMHFIRLQTDRATDSGLRSCLGNHASKSALSKLQIEVGTDVV